MARPLSDKKRAALLEAAIDLFAARGIDATPTAAVSKAAGVAEGSLFTYFKSKDGLVNALYRELKAELAGVLMQGFPRGGPVMKKLKHLWDQYAAWGDVNRKKMRVFDLLLQSSRIDEETRRQAAAPFHELEETLSQAIEDGTLRDLSGEFLNLIFVAMVSATLQMTAADPAGARKHRKDGFEAFWSAVRR